MTDNVNLPEKNNINSKIHTVRGEQVMMDYDLAILYQVEVRVLNQAVKRNQGRFPQDFMFQLTAEEYDSLRSQSVILNEQGRGKHRKYMPYAFTEQGVAMLSAVLRSETAIKVSIQIIQAFVQMRKLVSQNALLSQRMDRIEHQLCITDNKLELVFKAIEDKTIQPEKGIFFDGQVFDAYVFISKLIKSAKHSIVLIDNYVDESVLILLSKRIKGCSANIYTKMISKKLRLDLEKYNAQYEPIEIKEFNNAHDRFLVLDNNETYHIGASLKDLGKKWFAFSKIEKTSVLEIFKRLEQPQNTTKASINE
mgnify:CR=1 FL=1